MNFHLYIIILPYLEELNVNVWVNTYVWNQPYKIDIIYR